MGEYPAYVTVGFKCEDREAFDALMKRIRNKYRFCGEKDGATTQAFAVSMGNMFEEQDVTDALLNSDLDDYELRSALRDIPCNPDLRKLCAEYEVEHPYDQAPA
jgi:hypothetical protein